MTEIVRAPDPPLVDPETGETPPLSPKRWPPYGEALTLVVDPAKRQAYIEGSWNVAPEPDDAA